MFWFIFFVLFFSSQSGLGRGGLINKLSDEAEQRITLATKVFKTMSEQFLRGDIQMKTLNLIFQKEQKFVDLLKTGE